MRGSLSESLVFHERWSFRRGCLLCEAEAPSSPNSMPVLIP